jgi:glycosyltransferase involved in cell wall biosynthesis
VIGEAGIITPEGDTAALRNSIVQLMTYPEQHAILREKGRARVLAHFTHESVADATVQVYKMLQGQR